MTRSGKLLAALGVVLTLVTLGVGSLAGKVPACATGTVLELEVARTEQKATELIGGCDAAGLAELRDGLRADNRGFVPLYVVSVGLWALLGATQLTWSSSRKKAVVVAAAVAIDLAGLFDLVENHFLGKVVDAAGATSDIGTATSASYAKWVLVLFAVPTALVAMVRCLKAALRGGAVST